MAAYNSMNGMFANRPTYQTPMQMAEMFAAQQRAFAPLMGGTKPPPGMYNPQVARVLGEREYMAAAQQRPGFDPHAGVQANMDPRNYMHGVYRPPPTGPRIHPDQQAAYLRERTNGLARASALQRLAQIQAYGVAPSLD